MKLRTLWTQIAACSALALAGPAAHAALFNFTVTGDYTASFQIDSAPGPDTFTTFRTTFRDVAGFADANLGFADVTLYNASNGGGIVITDTDAVVDLLITDGPQLYTGLEAAPVFRTGIFALTQYQGTGSYTLTITAAAAAVPEPASAALLLAGLGVVGAMGLRRRKNGSASV